MNSVHISSEWIAKYAKRLGLSIKDVKDRVEAFEKAFEDATAGITNYCADGSDLPYLYDYLPKKIDEDSKKVSFDPDELRKKIGLSELKRKTAERNAHDEIRRRLKSGTM